MGRRIAISLVLLAASLLNVPDLARAQTVVDGSGASVPQGQLVRLLASVTHPFRDPLSSQFRGLRMMSSGVCGEVNTKNGYGAYVGFMPFGYEAAADRSAVLNPSSEVRDGAAEEFIRNIGCIDDGLPREQWVGLGARSKSCLADFDLLAASQGVEPPADGRDFNELFETLRQCSRDRLVPADLARRYGLLD